MWLNLLRTGRKPDEAIPKICNGKNVAIAKQARQTICASLLFTFLAACTPSSTPTALPTAEIISPTPTVASPTAAPTSQPISGDIQTYTVVDGDTITSIAASFGLRPETVLWANYDQLFDNPDMLFPGMQLQILPIDGLYHQVGGTDTVETIAAFFATEAQAIIDWPGNEIDPANPVIFSGQWLVVPGGQRFLNRRFMPNIPAFAMAVSPEEFGSGACPQNTAQSLVGDGQYDWPVAVHEIRGEGFWSAHPALDLAVEIGEKVLAADDGVVTFSGWSNLGYGYLVMLDHGNGEFSLYSGLGAVTASCGNEVAAGEQIGTGGVIGHPAGTFVHFEIRQGEDAVDPQTLLPQD